MKGRDKVFNICKTKIINIKMIKKGRSITIRIEQEVYDKIVKDAIDKSVMENKIVKVSDIIREKLEK